MVKRYLYVKKKIEKVHRLKIVIKLFSWGSSYWNY